MNLPLFVGSSVTLALTLDVGHDLALRAEAALLGILVTTLLGLGTPGPLPAPLTGMISPFNVFMNDTYPQSLHVKHGFFNFYVVGLNVAQKRAGQGFDGAVGHGDCGCGG